jgi:Ni/Co efflux regulator RcnB
VAHSMKIGASILLALALAAGSGSAQNRDERGRPEAGRPAAQEQARPATPKGEPHPGPRGYQRPAEPKGWNARPATVNRANYQHNYQAARSYKIGPYQPPAGWAPRRWAYGQILPRAYWAPEYVIADYWLFGLEVPPAGYEWVRDGADAILVSTINGEILQVEYSVFA